MVHEILNNFARKKVASQKIEQKETLSESLDGQKVEESKEEPEKSDKEWFNDTLQDFLTKKFVKK